MSRENLRRLFDSSKQYVVSMNSVLPSLDGSQLYNIKPASVRIAFTDSASDHVLWNAAGTAATVTHSLNCYPVVTVWDNNGMQLFPTITVLSATSFKMDFEYNVVISQQEPWYCIVNYGGEYGTGTDDSQELEPSSSSSSDFPSGSAMPPIIGNSDPTTSTEGVPGQIYYNESSDRAFLCIRLASGETQGEILYIWREIGGADSGGGSGGGGAWGSITGTLSNQTDLANALSSKLPSEQTSASTGLDLVIEPGRFYAWAPAGTGQLYPTINVAQSVDTSMAWLSIVHLTKGNTVQISSSTISMQEGTWRNLDSSFMMWIVCDGASVKAYRVVTRGMWASTNSGGYGVVGMVQNSGIGSGNGSIFINPALHSNIDNRTEENPTTGVSVNKRHPIVPATLDYAVRSVLPNVTVIPAATTAYTLLDASATTNNHSCKYRHAPTSAPTYTLPDVTDDTVEHEITLDVDCSNVTSLVFVDEDGEILSLQDDIEIALGDRWRFMCSYEYGIWMIFPMQLRNAVLIPDTPISVTGTVNTEITMFSMPVVSSDGEMVTWSNATGLPAGLTLDSAGLLTGTPTESGTFPCTAKAKSKYAPPLIVSFTITIA